MTTESVRACVDLFDATIAVERAMTPYQRLNFYARHTDIGPADSGRDGIADWISNADECDYALHIVEPWWQLYGDSAEALLRATGLPPSLNKPIISAALYACIGLNIVDYRQGMWEVFDLAQRAGLWARGYLEAQGWSPDDPGDLVGAPPLQPLAQAPALDRDRTLQMRWEVPIPAMTTNVAALLAAKLSDGPIKLTMQPGGPVVGELVGIEAVDDVLVGTSDLYPHGPLAELLSALDQTLLGSISTPADRP